MLRKGMLVAALGTLCLLPAVTSAQVRGPWELTLGGSGVNGSRFNGVSAGVNGSLGYFFGDTLEVALRQSISYTDIGVSKALDGSTRLAVDLHFPLGDQGQFMPFVGANIGYVYGDSTRDTWEAAPEAGIKVFVNPYTFIYGQAEYQFFFNRGGNLGNGFKDGQFVYTLGIGFRFG